MIEMNTTSKKGNKGSKVSWRNKPPAKMNSKNF